MPLLRPEIRPQKGRLNPVSSASTTLNDGDHLYLVDGSSFIFRAYHALPPLTRKSDGLPVGAVSGFCNMLAKLVDDHRTAKDEDKPTHLAVIFDPKGGSFRNTIFPEYKANRGAPPEDLVPQFPIVRDATRAFNISCIEIEGYEADDLIASYARQAVGKGARVTIVSSDKDLMQLIDDHVRMYDSMKNKVIDADGVVEKFGVGPDKVIDVQSLAGDSVDNIPGVPGIGVKTAAQLITDYGDLDTLLERAEEIKQPKRREKLIENADNARLSRELVTLKTDLELPEPFAALSVKDPEPETLLAFLAEMELSKLAQRLATTFDAEVPEIETKAAAPNQAEASDAGGPGALPFAVDGPIDPDTYEMVTDPARLEDWVARAIHQGFVAIDTETSSLDAMAADLVGVSLALQPGEACYVPLGHKGSNGDGLELSDDRPDQIAMDKALEILKPLFAHPGVLKIGQNLKYDLLLLKRLGVPVAPIDDTMLMSYALDGGVGHGNQGGHGMDALSSRHLGHTPIAFSDIAGKGKNQLTFDQIPVDQATRYAAEDADVTLRLWAVLKPRLAAEGLVTVYERLERPLIQVLVDMEFEGVKVDPDVLAGLSHRFAGRMDELQGEIHALAGEEFNIGSPKQLGEILFDKMGIEGGKKTKTGAWATPADVLEKLAAEGHDLPARILDWRSVQKLKSTYTDALPHFINVATGRVHTSYAMAATSTGRLSSTDPNLQNIPIRTTEGREIRTAFIAEPGHVLMSADYSQIELRVLAHMADIDALKQAFLDGLDIHAMTASEMFGVPIEGMDPMVRRRAKAINFGIIYGISAFGLANQLSIPRGEAKDYIDAYFDKFPGIRAYMEDTKEFCRDHGYVETIFGRKIHLLAINSKNGAERGFMERAAINAPIQGSAADIIRRAMIRIPGALADADLSARMLLQVHDELIFEVAEGEVDKTRAVVKQVMEGACAPALDLSVPLEVDAGTGPNWDDAH